MDAEKFVLNIKLFCLQRGIKPTVACKESGVGGSFINDIERGRTPSVAKVQTLAQYLGVTTSELLGETPPGAPALSPDLQTLSDALDRMNAEGRERLLELAAVMVASGQYIKANTANLGSKGA